MKSVSVAVLALLISAPSFASVGDNPTAECAAKAGVGLSASTKAKKNTSTVTAPQTIKEAKTHANGSAS